MHPNHYIKNFQPEKALFGLLPAVCAGALVLLIPILNQIQLINDNKTSIAIIAAFGFLIPYLREFLFHFVVFGIAFYSGRQAFQMFQYGQGESWVLHPSEWVSLLQWCFIGVFALIAGIVELWVSKAWGRKFYFLTIASYFLGLAMVASIQEEWAKMIALGCLGALAIYGAFAMPLVDREEEESAPEIPDHAVVEFKNKVTVRHYDD